MLSSSSSFYNPYIFSNLFSTTLSPYRFPINLIEVKGYTNDCGKKLYTNNVERDLISVLIYSELKCNSTDISDRDRCQRLPGEPALQFTFSRNPILPCTRTFSHIKFACFVPLAGYWSPVSTTTICLLHIGRISDYHTLTL